MIINNTQLTILTMGYHEILGFDNTSVGLTMHRLLSGVARMAILLKKYVFKENTLVEHNAELHLQRYSIAIMWEIHSDTHQLHYIPKYHFII